MFPEARRSAKGCMGRRPGGVRDRNRPGQRFGDPTPLPGPHRLCSQRPFILATRGAARFVELAQNRGRQSILSSLGLVLCKVGMPCRIFCLPPPDPVDSAPQSTGHHGRIHRPHLNPHFPYQPYNHDLAKREKALQGVGLSSVRFHPIGRGPGRRWRRTTGVLYDCKRIPYRIDRRLTGLAGT